MKGPPKRLGDIVDRICRGVGIDTRLMPGSYQLNKSEALAILAFVETTLKHKISGGDGDEGTSNGE